MVNFKTACFIDNTFGLKFQLKGNPVAFPFWLDRPTRLLLNSFPVVEAFVLKGYIAGAKATRCSAFSVENDTTLSKRKPEHVPPKGISLLTCFARSVFKTPARPAGGLGFKSASLILTRRELIVVP